MTTRRRYEITDSELERLKAFLRASAAPLEGTVVLADKAYGSKKISGFITAACENCYIPPKVNERP